MAKKKKTFRFNRIKIFVLIGVLVYASLTFFNQQTILASQISRQEELNAKQEELEKQIDYYKNELNYIGSDEYVEKQARERLGWLKPGDTKYVEENGASASPDAQQSTQPEPDASSEPSPAETGTPGE